MVKNVRDMEREASRKMVEKCRGDVEEVERKYEGVVRDREEMVELLKN